MEREGCDFGPDPIGTFEFTFVPAGSVLATATDPITGRIGEASGRIEEEDDIVCLELRQLGQGTVSGFVTSNDASVAGAIVDLTSSTGLSGSAANLKATATTGSEGEFVFQGVPEGSFTLRARVPGLLLTGTAKGSIETDGQEVSDIEIKLQPSGTIAGTVFRPDAMTEVLGASLLLKGLLRSESDVSGEYRFEFIPAGDFKLTAEETATGDAGLVTGTLGEGEELLVDVVFNGTGTVEGVAFDSDGNTPLDSGQVRLTRPAPFPRSETATVSPIDGSYRFLRIPVGEFSLSLKVPGSPRRGTAMGEITGDGETETLNIQLADSGSVLGRLVKTDGSTAAANVVVSVSGAGFLFTDLTDAEGAFRFDGIPLGDFSFLADDPATSAGAVAFGAIGANGEEDDLGTLVLDDTPIAVASISPDGTAPAPPDTLIVIRFTDPVEPQSLFGRVAVRSGGTNIPVGRSVSLDRLELTLTAPSFLFPRSVIEVFLSKDIEDALGRAMGTDFLSTFDTSGAVVMGTVTLASAPVEGAEVTLTAGASLLSTTFTDSAGHYRFEDVPTGNVAIQVSDPDSGQAGARVVNVAPEDAVITANISLAFVGGVTGQVSLFDGTFAGANLEVLILQSNGPVALALTDDQGQYLATNVPLGAFTVNVTDPTNGDQGQATGTLAAVETVTVDVQLLGVGSVRLFVRDFAGELIEAAEATLQFARFGQRTVLDNPSREPNGSLLFPFVVAGPITVEARDPATGLVTTVFETAIAGQETEVEIVLQPTGAISGQVFAPGGTPEVNGATVRLFANVGDFVGETTSGPIDGSFGFDELPVARGPYRIDVFVDFKLRARRRAIEVPPDDVLTVELELVGLGTVLGSVIPPAGETLSSFALVNLTSLTPDLGGFFSDRDVSDGTYEISDVPVGGFTLSAIDSVNGFLGEAEGEITADGEVVEINIELVDNAIDLRFGKNLFDGNTLSYTIQKSGRLINGLRSIFRASEPDVLHLEVTVDSVVTRFEGSDIGSQEEDGREIATAEQVIGGLAIRRKVFVPKDGYFARYLEIFENRSAGPITFSVAVISNLNNTNGAPRVINTSNGDAIIDPEDHWVVTDDNSSLDPFDAFSSPSIAWVAADADSPVPLVGFEGNIGSSDGRLTVSYDMTLPSAGRVIVMHFVAQQLIPAAAEEAARRLSGLGGEALEGLSPDEAADVANFVVPSDGTSALAPLPERNGVVTGTLFAHDGENAIGSTAQTSVRVKFQSDHILYRRIRQDFNDGVGKFEFKPIFTSNNSVAIPRTGFTLTAAPTAGGLTTATATAAGDFLGPSNFSRSPDAKVSASSSLFNSVLPEKAVDGSTSTSWRPASTDPDPTFELELPAPLPVDGIRLVPANGAQMLEVQVDLLGSSDEILESRVEPFPGPTQELLILFPAPVEGVHRISIHFTFVGSPSNAIRLAEIETLGTTGIDIGSTIEDMVFEGTSAISGTVRRHNGDGAESTLTFSSGTLRQTRRTDDEGFYFFAPIPGSRGNIRIDALALDNTLLEVTGRFFELFPDTTTIADITYPETTQVSGRVLSDTLTPLGGRTVSIQRASGGPTFFRVSGSVDGGFLFEEIPSGDYMLRTTDSGRTVSVPFTVGTPPTPVVQDIVIPVFGTVNLTALFQTAPTDPIMPVPRGRVEIKDSLDQNFRFVGFTPSSGQVGQLVINNVSAGPFTVRVFNPSTTAVFGEAQGTVDVEGQMVPITVIVPALGTITGTVFLGDGTTGASRPRVRLSGTGISPRSVLASTVGTYTFTLVEALLPFTVRAEHPQRSLIAAEAVDEIPGQGVTVQANLTLPKTGTLEVTVSQEGVGPLRADIYVQDSSSPDFFFRGRTSSTDGKLTVTPVQEGVFTVRAEGIVEGRFMTIGESTGEIVEHDEVVQVEIVRPAAATLEVTVVAGDGVTPIPRARIELRLEDDTLLRSVLADDVGFFRFENAFQAGENILVRAILPSDTSKVAEEIVTATDPGEILTLTLSLPVAVVTGSVLESDASTPVPGASVELFPEGAFATQSTTSDEFGEFSFLDTPSGVFELYAEDGFGLSAFVATDLPDGEFSLVQDILLPEFGEIEGHVTDAFGAPLTIEFVALTNANLRSPRFLIPDPSGFFRFERVALGSFNLTYDHQSDVFVDIGEGEFIIVPGAATDRLEIAGDPVAADITLPDVGNLFGEVLESNGDTNVTSDFPFLEGRLLESRFGFFRIQILSNEGVYLQDGIPAGDITVNARDGDVAGAATGTVVAGLENEVEVTLGNAEPLPMSVDPAPGISFDFEQVEPDGVLFGEIIASESNFSVSRARINGKFYPSLETAQPELSGSQLVFGPVRAGGLNYTRKVLVPEDTRVFRYLEILENPHPFDIEATLELSGFGSFSPATTSSGDDRLDATDRYFTSSFLGQVGVAVVFAGGTGGVRVPDAARATSDYALEWKRLTVPAGDRIILMHFFVQVEDLASAEAEAEALMNLSDPTAISDLTAEERAQVVNFLVP